ncbi:S24/S26 family peptidase [Saccharolobus islandicus]|uniref:Membrane protein n=2 Tax=Saccharolobus islandicus TaxID=43080 RepID=C3MVN9_SACI4|nr:S24/S26 family peptidase [Sulfolobus islandicus]ACP37476.1 membrane protein [Sulfolobus islandicus M.14.25]ACP54621.1 membrane protein [Sulfolobus islandicus M.16.27]
MSSYFLYYTSVKCFKILINVLLILLIVFSIIITSSNLFGRPTFLAITYGYSMFPVLKPGDVIITIPEPLAGPITNGSIIVFKDPDYGKIPGYPPYIIHQVISILPNGTFITKGINDNFIDQIYMSPITPSDVYGKAILINGRPLIFPYLGQIIVFLRSNIIFTIILFSILIFVNTGISKKGKTIKFSKVAFTISLGVIIFSLLLILSTFFTTYTTIVYSVSNRQGILVGGVNQPSAVNLGVILYNQSKQYSYTVSDRLLFPVVVAINVLGEGNYTINNNYFILYPKESHNVTIIILGNGYKGLHQLVVKTYVIVTLLPFSINMNDPLLSLLIYTSINTLALLSFIIIIVMNGDKV